RWTSRSRPSGIPAATRARPYRSPARARRIASSTLNASCAPSRARGPLPLGDREPDAERDQDRTHHRFERAADLGARQNIARGRDQTAVEDEPHQRDRGERDAEDGEIAEGGALLRDELRQQ